MNRLITLWDFIGRHKYLITLAVAFVIIGFADRNSLWHRFRLSREETRLREEIEKYQHEYDESTERLNELKADSGAIERIARERYFMKKPDEDIYVFEGDIAQ